MNEKIVWITPDQSRQYEELKKLIVILVDRYGWKGQLEADDDTYPEVRAAKIAIELEKSK